MYVVNEPEDERNGPRTLATPLDEEEAARLRELLAELGSHARAYRYLVAPNPVVGAAVLSNGIEIVKVSTG